jgi:hypothetical protein
MKVGLVYLFLIFVAVLGFAAWAFCQNVFVNTSVNASDHTRLLFPLVVPILAGVIVSAGYVIWLKQFPWPFLIASLKVPQNLLLLIGSSVGLALAYFLYSLLIRVDSKNIVLIPIGNTLLLTVIAFFVVYKDGDFVKPKLFSIRSLIEIIGAIITVIGVIIMKYPSWRK